MANCNSIRAFEYDACSPNIGGIKKIWLAAYKEDAVALKYEYGAEELDTVGNSIHEFNEITWIPFKLKKNTCSMASEVTVSSEGTSFVTTKLNLVFSKMEAQKRMAVQSLLLSECMCVVEDCNGIYWFLGLDGPVTVESGTGETGTAKSDSNRYSIVLSDESLEMPFTLDETAISMLSR